MKQKWSDFKILSISISALLLFFTISYFRMIPLNLLHLKLEWFSKGVGIYYFILTEIIAVLLTSIYIITYIQKDDKELIQRFKTMGIGIGAIALYFFLEAFEAVPLLLAHVNIDTMNMTVKLIYVVSYLIVTAALIALIYQKKLKKDFEKFKKNSSKYFSENIKYWLIATGVMLISNLLISNISTYGIAGNEKAIREVMNISPIYVFFSAVIFAPIVEELIFRQSIKNIFSNKWVFIIISGVVFGGLHAITDYKTAVDLLYIIPYSAHGIAFAYMLSKTDNIFVPMSFHMLHNGIIISLQIIVTLFA